ncbi:hypothetical protein BDV93DRAFT_338358 [Ceratobasidium sp. AG-I]|nr:hypothetical protein BDV93DRAFT_338358 [Ceratobasidium sp. AG-I]
MVSKSDVWGPDINHYANDFDLDAAQSAGDMSIANLPSSWEDTYVMPLALLETILRQPDLKQGYCYGDHPLTALILTLRNYERVNTGRIFKYYYGFLCIRCIMHIVCVGVLVETGTLDAFLTSLDQNLDWKQLCSSVAHKTIHQTVSAIQPESEPATRARFVAVFGNQKVLPSVGGITASNCTFVFRLLWEDRTSFLTLCERGILPGCPALLYIFSRVILAQPRTSVDIQTRLIQELCIRKYLSSSNREKYALREVSRSASHQAPKMKPIDLGEAVLEDNLVFICAYIRMVSS